MSGRKDRLRREATPGTGIETLERQGGGWRYVLRTPAGTVSGWTSGATRARVAADLQRQLGAYMARINFRPRGGRASVPLYNRRKRNLGETAAGEGA